jgi:uncharacterized protein involved in type VI secretion and phage assembly|nr:phage baseplate assembly protein V [Kofleriaceae bacterium]
METDVLEQLLDLVCNRYFGKYRGTVTSTDDETKRGRVQVSVPAVHGELKVWAMPCVPYAGPQVGFFSLPDVGTGVWVEFEAGDASSPIWTGCFWADKEIDDADSKATIKFWRTKAMKMRVDDDAAQIATESTKGGKVTIVDGVTAEKGNSKQVVDGSGVTAQAGGKKTQLSSGSFNVNGGALEVS